VARVLPILCAVVERRRAVSQQMVGIVVDKLLTDAKLRARFTRDRVETLAELNLRGFELTPDEFEVFVRTDANVWLLDDTLALIPCADD
jgi:hypothetical protein